MNNRDAMKLNLIGNIIRTVLLSITITYFFIPAARAQEATAKTISIEEFIQLATTNDTYFEQILIDQVKLHYRKDYLHYQLN